MLVLSIDLGVLFALISGYYDISLYKKGIMIYRHQKPARFVFRFVVCLVMALFMPHKINSFLIIGSSFWIVFDAYMGYGIDRNIFYTGKQSFLDEIGNSSIFYFLFKVVVFALSIYLYVQSAT